MKRSECTVVVEKLADGNYRATCPMFPDCEAVAPTEDAARRAIEESIETLLATRQKDDDPH